MPIARAPDGVERGHPRRHYRAIFISDVHLGTRGCQAELLLDFLRETDSQFLYLVGDIIDGWRLKRSWYWQQSHNDVVQKLLRKVRKGTRVVFVPGNHDEFARHFVTHSFGGIDTNWLRCNSSVVSDSRARTCPWVTISPTSASSDSIGCPSIRG